MRDQSFLVDVKRVVPVAPFGWGVDLPAFLTQPESPAFPGASCFSLFEDEKPLGPYHLFESRVAREGRGLFACRGNRFVFSTSDNSDPRTNGRSYKVVCCPKEQAPAPSNAQNEIVAVGSFPAVPRIVVIDTVNTCNAKCPFCPLFQGEAKLCRPPAVMSKEMSESLIRDISQWAEPPGSVWLGMNGEPLMDPMFAVRMDQIMYYGLGPRMALQTNGQLLDAAKARAILEAEIDKVVFGFDGATKAVYEAHRNGCSFEVVLENIRQFASLRDRLGAETRIQIMYIRTLENQHEVAQAHALFNAFLNEEKDCFEDRLALDWRASNEPPEAKLYYANKVIQNATPSGCSVARGQMVVHPDGTLAVCNLDYNLQVLGGGMGTVDDASALSVWKGEQRHAVDRVLSCQGPDPIPAFCRTCPAMYDCRFVEPQPCALPDLCTEQARTYYFYRFQKR